MPGPLESLEARRAEIVGQAQEMLKGLDGKPAEGDAADKLRTLDGEFQDVEKQIGEARTTDASVDRLRGAVDDAAKLRDQARPPVYGTPIDSKILEGFDTPGEAFTRSEAYQAWLARYPSGGPAIAMDAWSGPHEVGVLRNMIGMPSATEKLRGSLMSTDKFRTLVSSLGSPQSPSGDSGGVLVESFRRGLIEGNLARPLTIRDLVTVIPVTTDTVEYVAELSRAENAAPVEEAAALTGTSGTKPEGGLTFEKRSDSVKTIAEWVPATRRILSDAPQLRAYIDAYLTDDLALELEDQMIAGSGGGEDFEGILTVTGTQTADINDCADTTNGNALDILRAAKRKVRIGARTNATAVVINPEDQEMIDTLKAQNAAGSAGSFSYYGTNPFAFGAGNNTVWGMQFVESEAVDPGTAVVANWRFAVLFDRESTNIQVGTANDDFIRNIVRILAELRAGFGVIRPKAFCVVSF